VIVATDLRPPSFVGSGGNRADCEFNVRKCEVLKDANGEAPPKANWIEAKEGPTCRVSERGIASPQRLLQATCQDERVRQRQCFGRAGQVLSQLYRETLSFLK